MTERTTAPTPDAELDLLGDDLDDLDLLDAECAYDPLEMDEEKDLDEKAETFGYKGSPAEAAAAAAAADAARPQLPARERIERLFADMPPFKGWFLAIVEACREPQPTAAVERVVDDLRSRRQCVYGAANFCAMLCDAGALRKLTVDGAPYEDVEPQLEEVEENGRTYLRPTPPPEALWQATPEALEALADNDPFDALLSILDEQEAYLGVFREILGMCDSDGSSINQIKQQVNSNPALEYPKKSAQFFMDYLDRNGAIVWEGAWKLTDVGRRLLEHLEAQSA